MTRLCVLAIGTLAAVAAVPPALASSGEHCASTLVPLAVDGATVLATPVEIGCYETYAEALAAGSGGAIAVGPSTTPASLTNAQLEASTDASAESTLADVLIGTEWVETGYASTSHSYFAVVTCSDAVTWEVSYVGDSWNDDFESGKGFGGCDRNRKFEHASFGGSSVLCTPNCSTYGALNNEISSLRWRH